MNPSNQAKWLLLGGLPLLAAAWHLRAADYDSQPSPAVAPVNVAAATGEYSPLAVTLYDPDPQHLWNRLYSVLFVRANDKGKTLGLEETNPPLWQNSRYLFTPSRFKLAQATLSEFVSQKGASLIRDPLKRAFLQNDLWRLFDQLYGKDSLAKANHLQTDFPALRVDLVRAIRSLALSAQEIQKLPDNLAQAAASGNFPRAFDPSRPEQAYLPPDLEKPNSNWVRIESAADFFPGQLHVETVDGHNSYSIFLNLPNGVFATQESINSLQSIAQLWVVDPNPTTAATRGMVQNMPSPRLPKFPNGTQAAIVKRLMVIDDQGRLAGTPVTLSVQYRVHREPVGQSRVGRRLDDNQSYLEIYVQRPGLFAADAGGLVARGADERTYDDVFSSVDPFDSQYTPPPPRPLLQSCIACHSYPNVMSLRTFSTPGFDHTPGAPFKNPHLFPAQTPQPNFAHTIDWKSKQADWKSLKEYWAKAAP